MLSNDFVNSETLADTYIDSVRALKDMLRKGKTDECLTALTNLESSMQITLAVSELHEQKFVN